MPTINPIPDGAHLNLHPATPSRSIGKRPAPKAADLAPWTFQYASSPDGKDINLLIMFHGLGDNAGPFFQLAKEVNLPSTAILSLQGPLAIPLMETPTYWSWYQTFSPTLNPLPSPSPAPTVPKLQALIDKLTSPESGYGWGRRDIHLFGWGQGGSMVLSLARTYEVVDNGSGQAAGSGSIQGQGIQKPGGRLGSAVSICGPLLDAATASTSTGSSPSKPKAPTPIAFFTRASPSSAAYKKQTRDIEATFADVQILRGAQSQAGGQGQGQAQADGMLRGKEEWIGVMKFWAANLGRDDSAAVRNMGGQGEVYEVR